MIYSVSSSTYQSFLSSKGKSKDSLHENNNSNKQKIKEKGASLEDGRSG